MHTKLALVDGQIVFDGSTIIDPRLFDFNSEIGIVIDCRLLAKDILDLLNAVAPEYAFDDILAADRDPLWKCNSATGSEVEEQ